MTDWHYDDDGWKHCDRPSHYDDDTNEQVCSKCQASFSWEEVCETCGGTGVWESTTEESPTVLINLGPCPECHREENQ
jgi:DnaJ-class molecular chaperone